MEISFNTRINILGFLIGFVMIVSDRLYVYGQRANRYPEGTIRLLGGRTKSEGTVLIYHWSRWGSICDDYWDIRDANVVCNQLGYPGALQAPRRSRFGKGRRRIWLSGLHCRGNERHLTMCYSRGWGNYLRRCRGYMTSAGVICRPKSDETSTQRSRHRHRNRNRRTTTTSTTLPTSTTTTTTTTSTTTTTATTTTTPTTTPTTTTTIPTTTTTTTPQPTTTTRKPTTTQKLTTTSKPPSTTNDTAEILSLLGLEGDTVLLPESNSDSILQSDSANIQQRTRSQSALSSQVPAPAPAPLPVREEPTAETVIDDDGIGERPQAQDSIIPKVTSTKKPVTTTTTIPTTTTPKTTTLPPTTTTTRRPTTTRPPTTTTKKPTTTSVARVYNRWVYDRETWRYFMYFPDGTHITSRPDPRYYRYMRTSTTTSTTTTTTTPSPTTTTPRPSPTTRARTFNLYQISNELNSNRNSPGATALTEDARNEISNAIDGSSQEHRINDLVRHEGRHGHRHQADRKPGYIGDQPVGDATNNKIPGKPATPRPDAPDYTEFRVLGGREYNGYKEGRIEIRPAGSNTWGVICGDNWGMREAIVTCKHLGTGFARIAQKTDYYGGSNMDKVVSTVRCTGREDRLEDCKFEQTDRSPGREACSKPQSVAGVICETRLPDLEPDVRALQSSIYLQDRYSYYLTCAYEENCLSASANNLFKTRRWDYATRRLLRFSTIAMNNGKADFRPNIDRSQWEWHACHMHYHSMESFSHYDILDSHGNRVAEGHKASFCLEDSQCNRGVHPRYDCQNRGHQGISVGCRDAYLHDIDCQWIDITDVSPGTYTLKVELNPGMLVPEISYDNNVAKCKLYISSTHAQAWDCQLDSLL